MTEDNEGTGMVREGGAVSAGPIVFLTNRFNLLEILSSGLVAPRASFGKYYADFLDISRGRIPLFQAPLSSELIVRVSSKDESSFPVAIEIDASKVASTPVTALGRNGTTETQQLGRGGALTWAAGGAIPSVALRKVHFRSASDLEEHKLREYENVFANQLSFNISPEIFEKGRQARENVESWLAALPPLTAPSADEFSHYDRLSGARALAAHTASGEAMYGLLAFLGAGSAPKDGQPSAFPPWMSAENTIRPHKTSWRGKTTEERLYCSAVSVLRRANTAQAWRPLEVLAEFQAALAGTQLPKKDEGPIAKQFVAMSAILRNEREFRPFKTGVGSPVIKAMLMVLMRPEPARLLGWSRSESGAEDDVRLTAAVLIGVLHGHKRLSTEYRSPELDQLIAFASATEMCAGLPDAFRPSAEPIDLRISTLPVGTTGEKRLTLTWNGMAVLGKQSRGGVLADLLRTLDLKDPAIARVLAEVCLEHLWTDCIRSVVTTTNRSWSAAPRGEGLEILVQGPVSVRVDVDTEALRDRLNREALTPSDELGIAGRLRAPGAKYIEVPSDPQRSSSIVPESQSSTSDRPPSPNNPGS